jgi:osmotically-inducible protein OsmY
MKLNYWKVLLMAIAVVLLMNVLVSASETDKRIESSAKKSYVFRTYLKNDAIKIQAKNGVVKLTGTITEESHKALANETVVSLPGVKSVDNQLEFKGERPAENSDGWISLQIKYSLLYHRYVSGINTQVFVANGIVVLRGEAENQAEKDLATEYANDIKGVKDVKNEMTVAISAGKPKQTMGEKIDDASITAQVKMALLFHRSTSAFKTEVVTTNGIVTLSGMVLSGAGREIATKVASDVNGVNKVVNNMIIENSVSRK